LEPEDLYEVAWILSAS